MRSPSAEPSVRLQHPIDFARKERRILNVLKCIVGYDKIHTLIIQRHHAPIVNPRFIDDGIVQDRSIYVDADYILRFSAQITERAMYLCTRLGNGSPTGAQIDHGHLRLD